MKKNIFGEEVSPLKDILRYKYGENPFSILCTFSGNWLKRKRMWMKLIQPEQGRKNNMVYHACQVEYGKSFKGGFSSMSSVFDPVLCELMYNWFCPNGGYIFDPFAGESSKGIVAGSLGYHYVGIELRKEQVEENEKQLSKLNLKEKPLWICENSLNTKKIIKDQSFDFVFTSPPYYNLEKYSEDKNDISSFRTYEEFMIWYRKIFDQSVKILKNDRFLVVKVGEIRKPSGEYYGFVSDNIKMFCDLDLYFYNDIILYNTIGSLGLRTSNNFNKSLKIGRCHQNVLVFWKGDLKKIKEFISLKGKENAVKN